MMKPIDILIYEDDPKPAAVVQQHTEQVTKLTQKLQQSDFWKCIDEKKET